MRNNQLNQCLTKCCGQSFPNRSKQSSCFFHHLSEKAYSLARKRRKSLEKSCVGHGSKDASCESWHPASCTNLPWKSCHFVHLFRHWLLQTSKLYWMWLHWEFSRIVQIWTLNSLGNCLEAWRCLDFLQRKKGENHLQMVSANSNLSAQVSSGRPWIDIAQGSSRWNYEWDVVMMCPSCNVEMCVSETRRWELPLHASQLLLNVGWFHFLLEDSGSWHQLTWNQRNGLPPGSGTYWDRERWQRWFLLRWDWDYLGLLDCFPVTIQVQVLWSVRPAPRDLATIQLHNHESLRTNHKSP